MSELYAYRCLLEVEVTSDWSSICFENLLLERANVCKVLKFGKGRYNIKVYVDSINVNAKFKDRFKLVFKIECLMLFLGDEYRVIIEKGSIGYVKLRIYVVKDSKSRLIAEYVNSGVVPGTGGRNTRAYTLRLRDFISTCKPHVIFKFRHVPKLVLAFYYPWYGTPYGPSRKWHHWDGFIDGRVRNVVHISVLGVYDSKDPDVIRAHIRMAKYAGIDGFICSWWGIGSFEDEAFKVILKVAEEEGFKVTVYYESLRELSLDDVVSELEYILKNYAWGPAFLKIKGRPVIFIYAVSAKGRSVEDWKYIIASLYQRVNVKPLLIAETTDVRYLEVFEGIHTYGPIWVKNPEEFYHKFSLKSKYYISNSEFRSGVAYSKIFAATVIPGFYKKQPRRDGEYYREFWVAALKSKPDMILVTSWNELHEATEIEPTIECGFKYLKITRRYVEEYKGVKLPTPGKPRLKVEAKVLGREVLDGKTIWNMSLLISNNGSTALGIRINAGNSSYIEDYYPLNPRRNIVTIPMLDKGQKTKVNIKFFMKNFNNTIITITYYSLDGVEFNMTVGVYEKKIAKNVTVEGRTTVKQGIAEFKVVFRDRLRVVSKTVYVRNGSLLKLPLEFKIINLNNGTILKLQGFILENGTLIGLGETIRVVKPMVIEASWVRYYKVNIEYPVEYVNVSIIGDRVNSYVRENSTITIRARIRGLQPLAYYKPVIVVSGRMYENVSKLELRVTKPMVVRVFYRLEINPLGAIILIVLILLILIIVRTVKGMLRFWSIIFISA